MNARTIPLRRRLPRARFLLLPGLLTALGVLACGFWLLFLPAPRQLLPPLLIAAGGFLLLSMFALWSDIRTRLRTEARLQAETSLRIAVEDALEAGIHVLDRQGRMIYVNRAFTLMTGWRQDELVSKSLPLPCWPPEEIDRCETAYRAILAGRADEHGFQLPLMHRDGRRFEARLITAPLIDQSGKHTGWICSIYDVTELQQEREALQSSHERFVAVLNGLDSAVAVTDAETGELLLSNRQFDRAFNLPDWRGRCCVVPFVPRQSLPTSSAEWFDRFNHRWYQVKSRQSVWVDGSLVWLEIATDITTIKQAAQREREQNEQLQQTARLISMGEMASSLAHELNQPLAAIASYATGSRNLLNQSDPNREQLIVANDKIAEQARRAGQIIRGIREFVQRRAPHRAPCQIGMLIDTVLALLNSEIARLQVKIILPDMSTLPVIHGDPVMLEQVLFNLIRNAIEAMQNGPRRTLTIETHADAARLTVAVCDQGPGIAQEQLEQLFKPFFTTKASGMGMGLNICRSIIENHRGRLWMESHSGGGCRFIFALPLEAPNES